MPCVYLGRTYELGTDHLISRGGRVFKSVLFILFCFATTQIKFFCFVANQIICFAVRATVSFYFIFIIRKYRQVSLYIKQIHKPTKAFYFFSLKIKIILFFSLKIKTILLFFSKYLTPGYKMVGPLHQTEINKCF